MSQEQLIQALQGLLDKYTMLVNSGDAGNWDPEEEPEVIAAHAALSATQPAQAAQSAAASEAFSAMAAGVPVDAGWVKAQAAQGAGEVVAWALMDGDDVKNLIGRKRVAEILLKAGDEVRPLTYADTQPAAGADVLDAERYRMVRRGQHWSVINGIGDTLRGDDLDAAIDAVSVGQR